MGLCSALVSPAYLRTSHRSFFRPGRARAWYYLCFYLFWAALLAIPLAGNLGVAWVIIEATTGVSALLVAYNGRRRALEAGWKYLMLTTVGLTVALLGIVVLYAALPERSAGLGGLSWPGLPAAAPAMSRPAAVVGFLLLFCGLATKVGWAPVHNWLPDAHSEAPPPVSALLSAALLPTVMLVAWRTAAGAGAGGRARHRARRLHRLRPRCPWRWRCRSCGGPWPGSDCWPTRAWSTWACSPWASGSAARWPSPASCCTWPGTRWPSPSASTRPSRCSTCARRRGGIRCGASCGENPALAAGMSLSLGSLSGLPPSPLFFSEVLIIMGGFASGHPLSAAVAALLLALGFLGLAHVLVQDLLGPGRRPRRDGWPDGRGVNVTQRRRRRPAGRARRAGPGAARLGSVHTLGRSSAVTGGKTYREARRSLLRPTGRALAEWRERCAAVLADGGRFLALYAADRRRRGQRGRCGEGRRRARAVR